jgi:hypothetical protein
MIWGVGYSVRNILIYNNNPIPRPVVWGGVDLYIIEL